MTTLKYHPEIDSYRARIKMPRTGDTQQWVELVVVVDESRPTPATHVSNYNKPRVTVNAFVEVREPLTVEPVL